MIFRNGLGTEEKQEVTLAIRSKRTAFEALLAEAVPSAYVAEFYASEEVWKQVLECSPVRLQ